MTQSLSIVCLVTGQPAEAVIQQHGNFVDVFTQSLAYVRPRLPGIEISLEPIYVTENPAKVMPLDPKRHVGLVITGSAAMIDEAPPWLPLSFQIISEAALKGIPILGVCFGHQLLGHLHKGSVGRNPKGRTVGTVKIQKKVDHFLLQGLPEIFSVHVSHRDVVLELPTGAQILGNAAHDPHSIVQFGPQMWGLQFHPEWNSAMARAYCLVQREVLNRERGQGYAELQASTVQDTEAGRHILANFYEYCLRPFL